MPSFFKHDMPSRVDAKREKGRYVRRKLRACAQCKSDYLPPYGGRASVTNRFCSRKCYYASVGQRPAMVQATCVRCGIAFRRTVAALKRVKHAFCGDECRIAFTRGEKHPLYRGDKDPNRGAAWNRLAAAIRVRDCYSCRRCGRCEAGELTKLSVDHVRPWRSFADKVAANHPDNLVSLCRGCHSYKTTVVERAWLRGDVIAFNQWVKSLHLESATKGIDVRKDEAGNWFVTREELAVRQVRRD